MRRQTRFGHLLRIPVIYGKHRDILSLSPYIDRESEIAPARRTEPLMPTPAARLFALQVALEDLGEVLCGCSGGARSLILSAAAHRFLGQRASIVHIATPANDVDRRRAESYAQDQGWDFSIIAKDETHRRRSGHGDEDGMFGLMAQITDAPICAAASPEAVRAERDKGLVDSARRCGVWMPFLDLGYGANTIRELADSLNVSELAAQV